jgi:hypothetical protein
VVGLRPSLSAHVRWCERRAPVWNCGTRQRLEGEACGIPHLAKNERDAPNFLYAALDRNACAPFIKERRMKFREPTKLHRKSGMWGTRRCGWDGAQNAKPLAGTTELSSRRERSWAFGPRKKMKNGFRSATSLSGSALFPLVIPTGAQRSGGTCGFASLRNLPVLDGE